MRFLYKTKLTVSAVFRCIETNNQDLLCLPHIVVGRHIDFVLAVRRMSGGCPPYVRRMSAVCHKVCLRLFSLTVAWISMKLYMNTWYQA